jgi:hypothetical protein
MINGACKTQKKKHSQYQIHDNFYFDFKIHFVYFLV